MVRSTALSFYKTSDFIREAPEGGSGDEPYRSDFRRDFARLIHSPAFRRLQGKTQLFPGDESDFFRNRITHSLEVAQIAKSIALRLNSLMREMRFKTTGIDCDLVEFAALAHDLGHPPFGHTGEFALDERMRNFGGYEGNAQTLRILSRLEKKRTKSGIDSTDGTVEFDSEGDLRAGLNITSRGLASILKYDSEITHQRSSSDGLAKGYYATESGLVDEIKKNVLGDTLSREAGLTTVEMQIMDLADDIAYSTYDFEDALKANFTSPLDILLQVNSDEEVGSSVAKKLFRSKYNRDFDGERSPPSDADLFEEIKRNMSWAIIDIFFDVFIDIEQNMPIRSVRNSSERSFYGFIFSLQAHKMSKLAQTDGYSRTALTSEVVGRRVQSVSIDPNIKCPALSKVVISEEERFSIDVMKNLTYEIHIRSPRLRVIEARGKQIVSDIFQCLDDDKAGDLFPDDWRSRLAGIKRLPDSEPRRKRLIDDFISGMTDRYALEFHSRLKSSNPSVLFRPF